MAVKFEDLPPQVQNQLKQMQQLQQQLEMLVQQRLQLDVRLRETENALEELNKLEDGSLIYKTIGNLIIKADRETVLKELQEEKESSELRKKTLEGQETKIKEKLEELQTKIQEALRK
ncbi:MAG TPA: prefoldin subunit beta [Thermoplasmatales archaeon]|nr:MAG: prefoldin subunit beta [Thermoplasmata archaeon]HDN50648.1 prefoldin subunit beta [Thermoplasmatales archaeon]